MSTQNSLPDINQRVLEVKDIRKSFYTVTDETLVLDNVSFNVNKGEFVSILGPSGCGKTTLLSILSGLTKSSKGTVNIFGENQSLGFMFQQDTLFEWRTLLENCYLPIEIKKLDDSYKVDVNKLLKDFGLWEFRNKYPKELSGGMRQRVALIRSLATKPDLLLLDEPFSAVDYQTKMKLSQEVLDSIKALGKTAILVTHNIQEAVTMSDRVIVLSKRPTVVKKEIVIDYGKERNLQLIPKEDRYNVYFEEVWSEVMEYGVIEDGA